MPTLDSTTRRRCSTRPGIAIAVPLSLGLLAGCRTPAVVDELVTGADRAARTPTCLVVAPALMPADEVDADITNVVRRTADLHGSLVVILVRGPSASAFTHVRFDKDANGGSFASKARSAGRRDVDGARWGDVALAQIRATLADDASAAGRPDGLDLFGGLAACARLLPDGRKRRTIAVVSHGVHRTESLDLALDPSAAARGVVDLLDAVAPEPTRLVLLGLGRVDERTNTGPSARRVTEPVTAAWTDACTALAPRCTTQLP